MFSRGWLALYDGLLLLALVALVDRQADGKRPDHGTCEPDGQQSAAQPLRATGPGILQCLAQLLQQYVEPAEPFITRVEIVGGEFQYAIRSSTEDGFELCPAVECGSEDALCPADGNGKFSLREDLTAEDPLIRRYVDLMGAMRIDIAGIEFVEDRDGIRYTYDINGTTNYNQEVEERHGLDGMDAIARLAVRTLTGLAATAA